MINRIKTLLNLGEDNEYFRFIEECRGKVYPVGTELHTHHIIPKHMLGASVIEMRFRDSLENLIKLSVLDHVHAHQLLYNVYRRELDLAAVSMLQGDKKASRRIWRQQGAAPK
jgi:hypothetical protein